MPTEFSDCDECTVLYLAVEHQLNEFYKIDLDAMNKLMKEQNIKKEYAIKLIRDSKKYSKCSCCKERILCDIHHKRALDNAKIHNYGAHYSMCNMCCWFDI